MKTMSADYSCDIGQTYVDDVIPEFVPKMDKYIDMVLINDQIISEFHDKDRELEEDTGYKNKKKGGSGTERPRLSVNTKVDGLAEKLNTLAISNGKFAFVLHSKEPAAIF